MRLRELNIDSLNISKHLCNLESDEIMKKNLLVVKKRLIRLYVVSGYDFSSRDNGGASDPYLYITCNKTIINERDNYLLDEANPDFYKKYDIEGSFPGTSPLNIIAYDYDAIFGDDEIGTTQIDLEDRFFSMEW